MNEEYGHDGIERRPGYREEDLAVAREQLRRARRVWAVAVEHAGATFATGIRISFDAEGHPMLTHRDGASATLTALRAHVAAQLGGARV
jgi:hypothetical protein